MCWSYYDYGSAWIARSIDELTDEIRYQRLKKEREEFWKKWSKQIIFENNFKHWSSNFWKIVYSKWFKLWHFWNTLIYLFFLALLMVVIAFWILESFRHMIRIALPMIFIFYIFRSLVFLLYWHFAGLKEFTKLNGSSWGGQEGLIFQECKSIIKRVWRYFWKRPYPWMPKNFVTAEILHKLSDIVAITFDPDWLNGYPDIKLTRLLNNLQKSKQDLGGRIVLRKDFQTIESPITFWKFNIVGNNLLYDEQSTFTYSFSQQDIIAMKEECRILAEKIKNNSQF